LKEFFERKEKERIKNDKMSKSKFMKIFICKSKKLGFSAVK